MGPFVLQGIGLEVLHEMTSSPVQAADRGHPGLRITPEELIASEETVAAVVSYAGSGKVTGTAGPPGGARLDYL
jgi:hypothetical protein